MRETYIARIQKLESESNRHRLSIASIYSDIAVLTRRISLLYEKVEKLGETL